MYPKMDGLYEKILQKIDDSGVPPFMETPKGKFTMYTLLSFLPFLGQAASQQGHLVVCPHSGHRFSTRTRRSGGG